MVDVVLGLQWGDEGKGKIVDVLTPNYNVIARFQGGPNAGHTLIFNGKKYVLNTVPSGVFRQGAINLIGNGVVLDPVIFAKELATLEKQGEKVNKIYISKKTHLILPTHRILDAAQEEAKGKLKIGSTLKGIGPTYSDKIGRNGLRIGDVLSPKFMERYQALKDKHIHVLKQYDFEYAIADYEEEWFKGIEFLKSDKFEIVDSEEFVNNSINRGEKILAEGAQGSLLDVDFGTYPFVTSSNTTCAGVCTGLGIAPSKIGEVYGIFKAYCTRVGSGPFPTELHDATGKELAKVGNEFGSTTGRPRRCGWIDMVALRYSVMLNGVTQLFMMKADVLNGFETIKAAVAYNIDGEEVKYFPYETEGAFNPVYTELKGWNCDLSECRTYDDFPQELKDYVSFIEAEVGVPITIVSVGPDREETIIR